MDEAPDGLKLTNEQLFTICKDAEEFQTADRPADTKTLAFALQAVAICLHRLQAGEPTLSGEAVDRWYDQTIGQDVRRMWVKVKPAAEKLKTLGVLN